MLADENIDIIYVATPHSMHYENMKQAVNAGKHILCEKAITVNAAQLEEVLELAEEAHLPRIVFVNKMDRENADFDSILD